MNRRTLFLLLMTALVFGCRRNREPNKIIDGLPLKVEETVIPAYALQELSLLKRDNIHVIVTAINKTTLTSTSFSELTNVSSNTYQFHLTDAHYGSAVVTIQFTDPNGVPIDPITSQSSTATLKSVSINTTGTSSLYTYTENSALTLDIAGDITSTMRSTGTFTFTGSGYSILMSIPTPGARTTIDGFRDGALTATGTGPAGPVTMAIGLNNDQSVNGTLTWDGQSGSVHINNGGTGFVITSQARIPLE